MKKTIVALVVLCVIIAGGYLYLKRGVEAQVKPEIDRIAEDMRAQGVIASYKDLSVNVMARSVSLDGVSLEVDGQTMTIDEAVIFASPDYDKEGRFQMRGMNLTRDNLAALTDDPQSMPEHVKGDLELDYALDPAASRVNIKRLSAGVRELGLLDVSLDVEGVPENAFQGDVTALLMGYPNLALRSLSLRYEDAGFVKIALADAARQDGITPNEALKKIQDQFDGQIADAKAKNQPFAVEFLQAMKGFLNSQKGFEITASPEKPVNAATLMTLSDPKEAVKLLNLRAQSL